MFHPAGYAQKAPGSVAISREETSIGDLIKQSNDVANDTNKVKILNRIAGKYWYALSNHALDSCIYYANTALALSQHLHYISGRTEAIFLLCKGYTKSNKINFANATIKLVFGEARIRVLLVISEYYVFSLSTDRKEKDKAYPFLVHALALSDSVQSRLWTYQCLLLLGKYFFTKGDFDQGKSYFMAIIKDCHKINDIKQEAHYWSELGLYMPETSETCKLKIICDKNSYRRFLEVGDQEDAAYSLRDAAYQNLVHNQPDTALKQMLHVMSMLKSAGSKITANSLWMLSEMYDAKGMYREALFYGIQSINANDKAFELSNPFNYIRLAWLYNEENLIRKALLYNQLALKSLINTQSSAKYFVCNDIVTEEVALGNIREAKNFLLNFISDYPTKDPEAEELIAASLGRVYNALKEYNLAEINFRKMIALDAIVVSNKHSKILSTFNMPSSDAYTLFGEFMMEKKDYKTARFYLLKALSTNYNIGVNNVADLEYQLFKVDSATGNFLSAIKHYERHDLIKDSLDNLSKTKQIAGLRLSFEASQREQSIKLLQSDARLQHTELQKISWQRNLTVAGIIVSLTLAALLFYFFRQKQIINQKLEIQQEKINRQNNSLKELVNDKNWLLKEVHHRVKNNLHIITSLLETQSSFLTNKVALEAISESQSRIKAIALIHQRLYADSNLAIIEMPSYIHELVQYLKDSFNVSGKGITFDLNIHPVSLDVQQAVPLGLILNEAVTNAVKYAFTGKQNGQITVLLNVIRGPELIFKVEDNGVGLPDVLDLEKSMSMGMGMIKGLTKQLEGRLSIISDRGTKVRVAFLKMEFAENDVSIG